MLKNHYLTPEYSSTNPVLISAAARVVIEPEEVQFTGNSAYDDNGRFYVPNPSPINYKGSGPEVDDAWRNLTLAGRRYLLGDNINTLREIICSSLTDGDAFAIRTRLRYFRRRSQGAVAQ